jgi:hypothetical protein
MWLLSGLRSLALPFLLLLTVLLQPLSCPALTGEELDRVGRCIWQNESNGKIEGLTAWNSGENFASLGIGHFIWYPAGESGPFEESFPGLVVFLQREGVRVPEWLQQAADCPWPNRAVFLRERQSPRMKELRELLARTQREQVLYIMRRLDRSLPRYRSAAGPHADHVMANVDRLRRTEAGTFALIDYVNFKGDGLNPRERYKGEGWGLLQVLIAMEPGNAAQAPRAFATASQDVLTRRVENSPPERRERQWLQGWMNRCKRYANP